MRYSTRLYNLGNMAKIEFNGYCVVGHVVKTVFPWSYRAKIGIVRIVVTWRVE